MAYDPESIVKSGLSYEPEWVARTGAPLDEDTNPRGIPAVRMESAEHPVIIGSTVESPSPVVAHADANAMAGTYTNGIPPRPETSSEIPQSPRPLIVLPPPSFEAQTSTQPMQPSHAEPDSTEVLSEESEVAELDTTNQSSEAHEDSTLRQEETEPVSPESQRQGRDMEATKRKLAKVAASSRNVLGKATVAAGSYINGWLQAHKSFASETTEVRARITPEHPSPDLGMIKKVGAYAVYGTKNIGSIGGFTARNTPVAVRRAARFAYMPASVAGLYWSLFVNQGKSLLDQCIDAGFGAATALSVNAINNRRETNESSSRSLRVLGAAAITKLVPKRSRNIPESNGGPAQHEQTTGFIPARVAHNEQTTPDEDVLDAEDLHELVTSK